MILLGEIPRCRSYDKKCEEKNEEKRLKRQTICDKNPQCSYCPISPPQLKPDTDDLALVVEPEITATIAPLENISNMTETASEETPVVEINDADESKKSGKLIERNIIIENDDDVQYYRGYIEPSSNITTIIRLTNLINNTNIVNMPTTLNNTNINNIHVFNNKSSVEGGKFGLGYDENGSCCYSMKPGSCKQTTSGLKCRHKKTKVCGRQCTKKVIHSRKSMCNQVPYWPYMLCPQQMPNYYPNYFPNYPTFNNNNNDEFDDDDDLPLFPEDDELENVESGWIVHQEKCKIVSDDGLQITNCTDKNIEFDHPYARNSLDDQNKRKARHAGKMSQQSHHQQFQQFQQPPFMPYQMMQPVFVPIYMPPYLMPPQQQMPYYPQQMPMPPFNAEEYYDEPNVEARDSNQYRHSRKHAKKIPIIVEHDDEL
jgi:hypothetical protein